MIKLPWRLNLGIDSIFYIKRFVHHLSYLLRQEWFWHVTVNKSPPSYRNWSLIAYSCYLDSKLVNFYYCSVISRILGWSSTYTECDLLSLLIFNGEKVIIPRFYMNYHNRFYSIAQIIINLFNIYNIFFY